MLDGLVAAVATDPARGFGRMRRCPGTSQGLATLTRRTCRVDGVSRVELTMSCRFGGPEHSPADGVLLRRALVPALAPIAVDGLDVLDVRLTLGGSITSGEGHGGVHNLRYSAARKRITVNLVVPADEIAAASVLHAVGPHFAALARRVAERCAPQRADELAAAFDGALRGLA